MKHWSMAVFGAALLLGNGAAFADTPVDCKMPNENANPIAFFSANTNSGKGNGKEFVGLYDDGDAFCIVNGSGDDGGEQNGNAANPVYSPELELSIATDPGNSPN